MDISKLEDLKKLGFKQETEHKYVFKDIKAEILEGYIFFKYSDKRLPIIDGVENIKFLIKGIYNE